MKLSSKLILVVLFMATVFPCKMQAQGFFRNGENSSQNAGLRGGPDEGDDWGNPNDNNDQGGSNEPGGPSSLPMGKGFFFINLLAGGYAIIKRNTKKKV